MKNNSDNVAKKLETHIFCPITLFLKPPFMKKVEKYCRDGQATDDNMAFARFMLGTSGYKYTHSLRDTYDTYCFSTATMVARSTQCYVILTLPVLLKLAVVKFL
jgi:hypothetical protein